MSYRFVKITTFYPDFLSGYYKKNPQISFRSYDEQLAHLMRQEYGWSDYFATHLRESGVEAFEIVANAVPLQEAWGREHGIRGGGREVVLAQLKALRPDVVFVQDSYMFRRDWVEEIRARIPTVRLVIGWCCASFTEEHFENLRVFDCVLTCTPGFRDLFGKNGIRSYLMYHGFESKVLERLPAISDKRPVDFIFVGSVFLGSGQHIMRRQLLERLLESGIDIRIIGSAGHQSLSRLWLKRGAYFASKVAKAAGLKGALQHTTYGRRVMAVDTYPENQQPSVKLSSALRPPIYGIEMLAQLAQCKIGFNVHVDASGRYAGNMRLFEVTGVGTCLLTDWKENLHELFDEDYEIVTYRSIFECEEKVAWLLDHPHEREKIAQAGQKKCLGKHSLEKRVAEVNEIILNCLACK